MKIEEERKKEIVLRLKEIIAEYKLTPTDCHKIIPEFLYSLGADIEKAHDIKSSDEVLIRYGESPTFGNALMAQAIWMRDTWELPESEESTDG